MSRVFVRFVVMLAVLATVVATSGLTKPATAALRSAAVTDPVTSLWTENSSVNVFQNDLSKPGASKAISLVLAQNEYESAQIAIRKSQQFTVQRVEFHDLTGGGNTLAASNLTYQFVEYEHLNHNSSFIGQYPIDNPIRPAPGDFPDALSNDTTLVVPANTTRPIWIRAYAQTQQNPGIYTGSMTVVTSAGNSDVPITVEVKNVAIPAANQSSFTNAMWFSGFGSLGNDVDAPEPDAIEDAYKYPRYSTQWWNLMNNIATSMKQNRQNSLSIPMVTTLLDSGSTLNADGTYTFNWTKFDQIAQFFLDRGVLKQLEGFWWYYEMYDAPGGGPKIPKTEIITRNSAGASVRTYAGSDTAAVTKWNTAFLTALKNHITTEKHWDGMFWMHIADEITEDTTQRYNNGARAVHAIWPAVRIADANNIQESQEPVAGSENFLIPSLITADANPDYYAHAGKPFWLYTANIPVDSYLNRFIDQPQYDQREMMWYGYGLGATGYLHWAYNNWEYKLDDEDVKGDGWIVKPDPVHNTIKSTIRLESLRDGIEDWELLNKIGKTKPALAKSFVQALVTSATRYSQDTGFITRMHNALVSAAAGGPTFGTNLATGGVITASSSASGFEPGKAIDADPATSWKSAAGGTQWWQAALPQQAQIDGVRLTWGASAPTSFKVQLSYDGTKWSDAYAADSVSGSDTFAGINGKAKFVRITGSCPAAGCSIADLQIGGSVLALENLAGGKPYDKAAPNVDWPDIGDADSTNGVLAGQYDDHRSYGYVVPSTGSKTLTTSVTVDLQAIKSVGEVKIHRYEKYEQKYDPDSLVLATSTDKVTFTQKASVQGANGQDGLWYDLTFPASQARYVRVTFTKHYGSIQDYLFLDEIEAYAPPPAQSVNIAQSAAYTESELPDESYPDTNNAESTDGRVAGGYGDGIGYGFQLADLDRQPVVMTLELPAPKDVNLVKFAKYDDSVHNYAPDRVDVYTSADGGSYQYQGSAAWGTGQWYDIAFSDTVASYIRLDLSKVSGDFAEYLFVDEVAAFGNQALSPANIARGRAYVASTGIDPNYPDNGGDSTDGVIAGHYSDHRSYGYVVANGATRAVTVTVDLGSAQPVNLARFWRYNDGVHNYQPDFLAVSTSIDGTTFTSGETVTAASGPRWFTAAFPQVTARFVRFAATKTYGDFADYIFVDEVEAYAV